MDGDRPRVIRVNRKGSKVLFYRGYKYIKTKVKLNSIFWRCSKDCGVYIQTNLFNIDDENADVHNVNNHNHNVELEELKKDELKKKFTDQSLSKSFVQSK